MKLIESFPIKLIILLFGTKGDESMNEMSYARQFTAGKSGFLRGGVLQDWEKVALSSYAAVKNIRQSLGTFFVLLALNAGFRLFMMGNTSHEVQSAMMTELGGFVIVTILALVTFFVPRWWMILITAIAIFPFAIGIITGLMAIAFLCMVPFLKRTQASLYISGDEYIEMKPLFEDIASGKMSDMWPEIARVGKMSFRTRFFENAAVFLSGKNPVNTLTATEAQQCEFGTDKKGNRVLKKWVVNGKLKKTNIVLMGDGATRLQVWMSKNKPASTESK
jgi:hypothetical protein